MPDDLERIVAFVRREAPGRRPPARHGRSRRHARRHHPRGDRGRVRGAAGAGACARRRAARPIPGRAGVRGALGGAAARRTAAREPARRRTGLPARERLGAARAAERDGGDVRPLRRRAADGAADRRPGGARIARASRRSWRLSLQATERWPAVLVGSYPSFRDDGPRVEIVLKSSDPRRARRGERVRRGRARS